MSRDEASTESSSAPAVGAGEGRRAGRESFGYRAIR